LIVSINLSGNLQWVLLKKIIQTRTYIPQYIYMCACIFTCVLAYIYIYTHTYINVCTYALIGLH